jgi:NAD(P) transhydrogenase subunit alpha
VIVDLAAEEGGNCELCEAGRIVERHGVTIIGTTEIAGTVPRDSSAVYARNVYNVVKQLHPKGTELHLDFADEITDGAVVLHDGSCRAEKVREAHGFPAPARE